jgi:hypothetical protein
MMLACPEIHQGAVSLWENMVISASAGGCAFETSLREDQ